jgi:hypothetical protein
VGKRRSIISELLQKIGTSPERCITGEPCSQNKTATVALIDLFPYAQFFVKPKAVNQPTNQSIIIMKLFASIVILASAFGFASAAPTVVSLSICCLLIVEVLTLWENLEYTL